MATKKSWINQPTTSVEEIELSSQDATASQAVAAAAHVHGVILDNTLPAAKTYVKFYDSASPVVGTTAPHMQIPVLAGQECQVMFAGKAKPNFATQVQVAAVTAPGTAGTSSPAAQFNMSVLKDT